MAVFILCHQTSTILGEAALQTLSRFYNKVFFCFGIQLFAFVCFLLLLSDLLCSSFPPFAEHLAERQVFALLAVSAASCKMRNYAVPWPIVSHRLLSSSSCYFSCQRFFCIAKVWQRHWRMESAVKPHTHTVDVILGEASLNCNSAETETFLFGRLINMSRHYPSMH